MKFHRLRRNRPFYRYEAGLLVLAGCLLIRAGWAAEATPWAADSPQSAVSGGGLPASAAAPLLYDIPPMPAADRSWSTAPTPTTPPPPSPAPSQPPGASQPPAPSQPPGASQVANGFAAADASDAADTSAATDSYRRAAELVNRTLERLALGDAFDAKLRQRIRVGGREVVGIGHYEQSGGGTGRYSMEMTVHDGDLRHTNQQISDGKLAWVRTQLGSTVSLRRVDLGRIDELHRELARRTQASTVPLAATATSASGISPIGGAPAGGGAPFHAASSVATAGHEVPPWLRVGGLVELVDQIAADFDLRISQGMVEQQPVWILRGTMNAAAQQRIHSDSGDWSALLPYEVRLAIAASNRDNGFGVGLPCRVEFWSRPDPADAASETVAADADSNTTNSHSRAIAGLHHPELPRGELISVLEIYAHRPIEPSPEKRFRFEREERNVTFSEDTLYYLQRMTAPYVAQGQSAAAAEPTGQAF